MVKTIKVKDDALHRAMKVEAASRGMSMEDLVEALLRAGMEQYTGAGSSARIERDPPKVEVAGSSPAPPVDPADTVPDGRWRLEGQYQSDRYITPFYRTVAGGVVAWRDDDGDDLDSATVFSIEQMLGEDKPKVRLKEVLD